MPRHNQPESDSSSRDPFFIVGTGRCGTTLLQAMLNAHPGLYIPRETHFFFEIDPRYLGFEDPVSDRDAQPYIDEVTGGAWWAKLPSHWPNQFDHFADAVHAGCRSSRDLFAWLLDALTPPELSGRRLGEKSPHHEKHIDRILELFPSARIIHLRRDPRDVTEAMLRMPWWNHTSTFATARSWARIYDRAIQHTARLGPEQYHTVRYEDLVSSPRETTERICGFLGEPFCESILAHDKNPQTAFSSAEAPYKANALKQVSTSHVHKYRGRLTARQIRVIERTAGPRLAEAGYALDETVRRLPGQRAMAMIDRLQWKLTGR